MSTTQQSTAVIRAAELDAAGRHDDAINALARAAKQGDTEATTQLAKRIVVGDRAPRLRRQGMGLLQDAMQQGGAEAPDRLATLFAAGAAGRPDWTAALELLGVAARRGWVPAQRQLEVLASMNGPQPAGQSAQAGSAPGSSASSGAAHLDHGAWWEPPAGHTLHEDPLIRSFPDFVTGAVCDWLIERARSKLTRALVYDPIKQVNFADKSRTNSSAGFDLMEADLVHLMVQARMAAACGQPANHMEAPTVLHYAVGESIVNHFDFVDPKTPNYAEEIRTNGQRVITFLIYLNAGYEGGETEFPRLGLSHSGQRGEGMFFVNALADRQADLRTVHSGRPPTRGEKWVFSQFVRDRPEIRAE